jgi:hypothetical protein
MLISQAVRLETNTRVEGDRPGNLRVHMLSNAEIWSMTWHFRRPDGRATFQFIETNGVTKVFLRRIGGHEIYADE